MLLVKARVGESKIHGLGLIAQELIPKGTVIWRLAPEFDVLLTEHELGQLPEITQKYVLWYGHFDQMLRKHVLTSDDDRFTNHSDTANSKFLGRESVAARDIQAGEEITDNYREYAKPLEFLSKQQP